MPEGATLKTVTYADIERAATRLAGVAHYTPVLTSRQLNERSGCTVFLKCENFQRIGAFKFRGAFNAVSCLGSESRPVVALSSGNHAQGVALACRLKGWPVHVVMHRPINPLKRAAVSGYGAVIHETATRADAESTVRQLVETLHATDVHAFNDPDIVAGQGTVMKEFLETVPDLEVALAPIGGGGLLAGACLAGHAINPGLRLYACEPLGALDAIHSVRENRIVPMDHPKTIAEGLRTSVGDVTLPILRSHLAGFFTVDEEEIVAGMRFVYERMKVVIEPSSAVALAPLLRREPALIGKRVGVIITGGNVDLSSFFEGLRL